MSDSLVSSKGQHDCPDATVAQLVAQRIRNAWVAGSSPASGLRKTLEKSRVLFFGLMSETVDIIFLVTIWLLQVLKIIMFPP